MATIAEMLIASGLESSKQAPDLTDAMMKGAQLAQQKQAMEMQRASLEKQKAEAGLQKYDKILETIKLANNTNDKAAKQAIMTYTIPKMVDAFGAGDVFTPEMLKLYTQSPDAAMKAFGYQGQIQQRILDGEDPIRVVEEVKATISDPATLISLDTDKILKNAELAKTEANALQRTREGFGAAAQRQQVDIGSAGVVESKKQIAKLHSNFTAAGGKSGVQKNLENLAKVREQLASGQIKTGGVINAGLANSPRALAVKDPKLKAAVDDVRGAINLKAGLADPNPTEMQINQILSRAIDISLPPEENIKKLDAMMNEIKSDVTNKQQEFIRDGLMKPEEAISFDSPAKTNVNTKMKEVYGRMDTAQKQQAIKAFAQKYKVTEAEAKKALEE